MYINVQYLKKIEKSFSGNYVGYLKESSLQISISRRYVKSLFEFLRSVYR
ncbi:LytTR family transcriptional regulator DNA-binding domain-containing protein [Enterococcus termitis]